MSKASIPSMELARSMNLQSHVMTIEEGLRHSEMIKQWRDSNTTEYYQEKCRKPVKSRLERNTENNFMLLLITVIIHSFFAPTP